MTVKNPDCRTLTEWAQESDRSGKALDIVEILNQSNEMLTDAQYIQANQGNSHAVSIRTGHPEVYFRKLNQGVPLSSSKSVLVKETCALMDVFSECDKEAAKITGDINKFRLNEATAHVEAMSQKQAKTMVYGNSKISPEHFMGFIPRYSDRSAANGVNILDGGGRASDNTSILFVTWGENQSFGTFPLGSTAGLVHEDLGEHTSETFGGEGTRMQILRDHFIWNNGLVVKDWRYNVRIANIDVKNLRSGTGAADIIDLLIGATYRIPNLNAGKTIVYANRTILEHLDKQRMKAVSTGGGLTYDNVDGKVQWSFRALPIRISDALINTEETVAFA